MASVCNRADRFVNQYNRLTFKKWPMDDRKRLNTLNPEEILLSEAAERGLYLETSLVKAKNSGREVFAARTFDAGDVN